jgi:hypothetical protein
MGIQRVELQELRFRRIGKPKENSSGSVRLNANGQAIEFRQSYPLGKETAFEHRQWTYDGAGVFRAGYSSMDPSQAPILHNDSLVYENGRVVSKHFLDLRRGMFFETRYVWDDAGHLLQSWYYVGDSSQRNVANAKIEQYMYSEDGRVLVQSSHLGGLRIEFKLEYSGDRICAFQSNFGTQPGMRHDIVLNAQRLPIQVTTSARHGKRWRPISQLSYVYQ